MRNKHNLYYQKLAGYKDPQDVFKHLFGKSNQAFWLDSSRVEEGLSRFSYMGEVKKVISYDLFLNEITVRQGKEKRILKTDIFSYLKKQLAKNSCNSNLPFGFRGGFVGYFGYELKSLCGSLNKHKSELPDSLWFFIDRFIAFDHEKKEVYLVFLSKKRNSHKKWFEEIESRIMNYELSKVSPHSINVVQHLMRDPFDIDSRFRGNDRKRDPSARPQDDKIKFILDRSEKQYLADVEKCKEYLKLGESYQMCLTNKITVKSKITPLDLYLTLRKVNPAPYSAYISYNDLSILCSSPEKFLTIDSNRNVTSKPIKGTIKRGDDPKSDLSLAKTLQNDPKEKAENLMIVDLVRNDLGRVCKLGSIKVEKLMAIESYQTVHQLVSTIRGKLKDNLSVIDCIKACFPGGSMTGAPKIRTMELLEKIEKKARGIYSGSLGFLSFSGEIDLNIVIRTIIMNKDKATIGVGGAVLIDSDPKHEFEETMLKAKALLEAISKTYA